MKSISDLVADIKRYNEAYRVGNPEISDSEYDRLVDELRNLNPNNEWFSSAEPAPVLTGRKRKLPIPMKSLNKVKSLFELQQWTKSLALPPTTQLVITPKYDGVSWLHDEVAHKTYSRGGAENEGQDCSEHFNSGNFGEVSDQSVFPVSYTYGELVFSRTNWEDHMVGKKSISTGEPYRSPRNTVAGFINRDEVSEDIKYASFVRYGVDEKSLDNWTRYSDLLEDLCIEFWQMLNTQNGQKHPFTTVKLQDLTEAKLSELFLFWRQHFYIDGLVLYIDDLSLWKAIGRQQTSGNPLYAIAYKHPDFTESFETKVKSVNWRASKSGALKPVVNIETVDTGDCNMENPTGYNAGWIYDHHIAPGAEVLVTRSGGVIPKILETITPPNPMDEKQMWYEIHKCPHCGHETQFDEKEIELYCLNPDCPGIKLAKIIFFFTTVGSENMGDETFAKLFDAGHTSVKDILNLTPDDILRIEGFGESMVNTILDNNRKIREGVDLATLMQASDCFKGIGRIKAQKILDSLSPTLFDYFIRGKVECLSQQPEFKSPSITLQSFLDGVSPFHEFLMETGVEFKIAVQETMVDGKYSGFAVCFSGIRDKELEESIVKQGGKIASGVSKTTTHLVVKDPADTSSKIGKAHQLNIPILTIDQFKGL